MMRHCVFLCLALGLLRPTLTHAESLDPVRLALEIKSFIHHELKDERIDPTDEYAVVVSNLDPRLNLEACDDTPDKRITSQRPYGANLSVKVSCKAPKPWTLYVPAKVEQISNVAVLVRSLSRGTVIEPGDVSIERMNVAQAGYGYLRDPQRAVGMELKKPLQAGQTLRLMHLTHPELVKRGDKVVLEVSNRAINVVATGYALGAGKKGDQIRVRNEKSERVVDATVVAPGRVKVGGW